MALPLLAPLFTMLARELVTSAVLSIFRDNAFGGSTASIHATVTLDVERLKALKGKARKAVFIGAARAAKPLRAEVINQAQGIAQHGFTAKSIGTKTRFFPKTASIVTVVGPKMSYTRQKGKFSRGPRAGEARKHTPYLYSWILIRGSQHAAANDFLGRAMDSVGEQFPQRVTTEIAAELAKLG